MSDTVEVYRRVDGRWAWRRLAPNEQVIATDGGQGYESKAECVEMASRVNIDTPIIVEEGDASAVQS